MRPALRLAPAAALLGLTAAAIVVLVSPLSDPDYWWHLRAGEQIASTGHLHRTDPWSLSADWLDPGVTADTRVLEWPPLTWGEYQETIHSLEWLSQLAFHGLYELAGHAGPQVAAIVLTLLGLALGLGLAASRGAPLALVAPTAVLALWVVHPFADPRPQVFSYLLAAASPWIWERLRQGRRLDLLLLFGLGVAWSNLHGGYAVGLLIGLAFLGGAVAERLLGRDVRLGWIASGWLLLLTGCACNPNGMKAVPAAIVQSRGLFTRAVTEWMPVDPVQDWAFCLLLASSVTVVAWTVLRRNGPIGHLLLVLGLGAMGIMAVRHQPFFALVGVPAALLSIALAAPWRSWPALMTGPLARLRAWLAAGGWVAAGLLMTWLAVTTRPHVLRIDERRVPVAMTRHLNELDVAGPVFNTYDQGGYLLWALEPKRQVFIDGRSLSERSLWEYVRVTVAARPLYPGLLERYDIPIVAIRIVHRGAIVPLALALAKDDAWTLTFVGPNSAAWVRTEVLPVAARPEQDLRPSLYAEMAACIKRADIPEQGRAVGLAVVAARLGLVRDAESLAREADRAEIDDAALQDQRTVIQREIGEALARQGRWAQALEALGATQDDREAGAAAALVLHRMAQAGLADPAAAVAALERAAVRGTCEADVHGILGDLTGLSPDLPPATLLGRGRFRATLERVASMRAQGAPARAGELSFYEGTALLKLCRYGEAREALERSIAEGGGPTEAPPVAVRNLGWAYFDDGHVAEALDLFEGLLVRDGRDREALFGAGLAAKFAGRRERAEACFRSYLETGGAANDPWRREVLDNLRELDEREAIFRSL